MFKYTKKFDEEYAYQGRDLGVICKDESTQFKIWAPFAKKVELCIYQEGGMAMTLDEKSEPENCTKYVMNAEDKGVFSKKFDENMHGYFYDFLLYTEEERIRTADPYAIACAANGRRSAVVDLSRTNPEGFLEEKSPEVPTENIYYELHVKDFSYDKNSNVEEAYRGKYKAFTVPSKGIEHIKKLGITHIHLLPFYDYGSVDEVGDSEQFNWGYDPLNYNIPEGSYATDVSDPATRIKECKEMIMALHKAGIRVVMDVVYNHTYEADSWLERSAKGYYNRRYEDGTLADGSACGCDVAAGRAMADQYIVDSVLYWAKEYHLDGFRFDLMGLLTTELMNRIKTELDAVYGEGEKCLYGEPWAAADSPMEADVHAALKVNVGHLDKNIAVFCDATRDCIKGDVFHADWPGFINGAKGLEEDVLKAASGWIAGTDGFHPLSSTQIVNYVSAHDNYTLWDKLIFTSEYKEYDVPYNTILAQNKLAAFIYFTCQGSVFMQAGEEFARTKYGDENSFRSKPTINMIQWDNEEKFANLNQYYCGLIKLRKSLPGFYEKRDDKVFEQKVLGEGVVSFKVKNTEDSELLVVYNASKEDIKVETDSKGWVILVDDQEADCNKMVTDEITVKACSGMLLKREM